jgi:hypothetical protein
LRHRFEAGSSAEAQRDWIDIELDKGHEHAAGNRLALP